MSYECRSWIHQPRQLRLKNPELLNLDPVVVDRNLLCVRRKIVFFSHELKLVVAVKFASNLPGSARLRKIQNLIQRGSN